MLHLAGISGRVDCRRAERCCAAGWVRGAVALESSCWVATPSGRGSKAVSKRIWAFSKARRLATRAVRRRGGGRCGPPPRSRCLKCVSEVYWTLKSGLLRVSRMAATRDFWRRCPPGLGRAVGQRNRPVKAPSPCSSRSPYRDTRGLELVRAEARSAAHSASSGSGRWSRA